MKEVPVVVQTISEGCLTTSLAAGNERQSAFGKCHVDCLSCADLSRSLEVKSNIIGRTYSSIKIKSHKIYRKIRTHIYLLACKNSGIQYVGERIALVNLRMNIYQKGRSGCEHSINHYKNVCKGTSFFILIQEKLERYGFKNGQRDFAMQELLLKREHYWMKKLHSIYSYDLNESVKTVT